MIICPFPISDPGSHFRSGFELFSKIDAKMALDCMALPLKPLSLLNLVGMSSDDLGIKLDLTK